MTVVIAIAMDIWSNRHASACNLCIVSIVPCALELRSRSLATVANLVRVRITFDPIVTIQPPSPKTPNVEVLEIRKGVTRKPCCLQSRNTPSWGTLWPNSSLATWITMLMLEADHKKTYGVTRTHQGAFHHLRLANSILKLYFNYTPYIPLIPALRGLIKCC